MAAPLTHPVVLLVLLGTSSEVVRRFLMGSGDSPVPSGGIVMAGGIFAIAALGELPLPTLVGELIVLELLVVWGYLAVSYLKGLRRGGLGRSIRQPMNAFAVGTWVAGSAVLGRALLQTLPGWYPAALALWLVAIALWLWYASLLPAAFRDAADPSGGYRATGAVLLPVVATQSLLVAGDALLPGGAPRVAETALVSLGYLLYAGGLVLICRRYLRLDWTLAEGWDNTNCILHGATSITGLAIVLTGAFPDAWAAVTWVWALAALLLVEAAEVARAFVRVRTHGWKDGVFAYLPSQWSRNFTFGMFYAFTLQLQTDSVEIPWAGGLQAAVASYGQYVVLAFLVAETVIFLSDRVRSVPRATKSAA